VHRFYQMWQQSDCDVRQASSTNPSGCLSDLYPFVATTFADVNVGGGTAMAFFNMAAGDAPYLKQLADEFTISDNYHQPQMGGSHAQMIYLGMADAIFYADAKGEPTIPPYRLIANPEPLGETNNRYTQDSVYSACFDRSQPGVASIRDYLASLPYAPDPKCEKGHYYLLNNAAPGFELDGTRSTNPMAVPPSRVRTIADALAEKGLSFRYYGGGLRSALSRISDGYCALCNPFQHVSSIMKNDSRRSMVLKDVHDLISDIVYDTLPAVSYVKPDGYLDGHPANSKLNLFEAFVRNIVERIRAKPAMFARTAILVTFDEGGGYYDSGFIQPIDFFGDGPRIPLIVVSPYSTRGRIVHNYSDHVSVVKFIERNWHLAPLTSRSRDNLPNPIASISSPYIPANMPAIGDLFDAFQFNLRRR
jgi:phospholipase C